MDQTHEPDRDPGETEPCRHCGEPVNEPPGTINGQRILWHTESMQVHCPDWRNQAQRSPSSR